MSEKASAVAQASTIPRQDTLQRVAFLYSALVVVNVFDSHSILLALRSLWCIAYLVGCFDANVCSRGSKVHVVCGYNERTSM